MYCNYCGYKIDNDSKFCAKCGKQIIKAEKNIFKKCMNTSNTNLAEQLFNTLTVGNDIDNLYKFQVNKILKECTPKGKDFPNRQEVLLHIINLIGEPKNSKERFIIAKAYAWSHVKYRKEAIKYLELYLNNDLYIDSYSHKHHFHNSTLEDEKKYHLIEMYDYLAKAYEGEHDLEKALINYEKIIQIFPENPRGYVGKKRILIKLNKLEECHNWLCSVKKSKYYKIHYIPTADGKKLKDDWFKTTIDELIK